MSRFAKRPLLRLAVGVAGVVLVYGGVTLLTPTFGRVVGYANHQPPLRVDSSTSVDAVEHIRRLATLHLDYRPAIRQFYWPEPSAIAEHADCWLVTFTRKDLIYCWLGLETTIRATDRVMFLTISKTDETARFGRWCP